MRKKTESLLTLSRRERQILDSIYQRGQATAAQVMNDLPDAPTYTTVRTLLSVLERKGHVRHTKERQHFVYYPVQHRKDSGDAMLRHVLQIFFNGSPADALSSLLGDVETIDKKELLNLHKLIEDARKRKTR
jgi:BlaI family penicillinase repressor